MNNQKIKIIGIGSRTRSEKCVLSGNEATGYIDRGQGEEPCEI